MDPIYGGNNGMVGWQLTGFTGADYGDSYNNGRDVMKLMVLVLQRVIRLTAWDSSKKQWGDCEGKI